MKMLTYYRLLVLISFCESLLFIPLLAMLLSDAVNWNGKDFMVMAFLLLSLAVCIEIMLRKVKTPKNRLLFIAFFILAYTLIWTELAVGIFNSPFAGS
jgi:glucose-6-phosphate-specific signal transduction histidine kinase